MAFALLILLTALVFLFWSALRNGTTVRKCSSLSCKYNLGSRCAHGTIDIYDNGAVGICLWHSSNMQERILDPFLKGYKAGELSSKADLIDKIIADLENERDAQAIKDPKSFEKWMKRRLEREEEGTR